LEENLKLNKLKIFQVSVDGSASSGKSTGAKLISKKYGLSFLSSGLLYRYASYRILKDKPKNQIYFLKKIFKNLNYKNLNKIDLHNATISENTSKIARIKKIRDILKIYQVNFSKKNKRCCIEGRDISTKILPNSDVKFYFTCELNKAAKRRFKELKKKDKLIKLEEVKKSLKVRNLTDKKRKHSPLLKHTDALEIDTGKLDIPGMVRKMSLAINKKIKFKYGN
jgi:CMP/dCMP kinase|tara:strand:+ start:5626 stop:6297 length:672 start_codon:yes stop_codon:yes gene_type:complete